MNVRIGLKTVGLLGAGIALAGCTREVPGGPTVHARIGPDGGVLSSHDSVVTIAILPGALDTEVDFFIEPTAAPPEIYGPAYRVDPNPQLHVDATVTYRFGLPPERAAVVAVDPVDYASGDARWTLLPRIDVDDNLVKGRDSQISVFYGLLDDGPLLIDDGDDDDEGPEPTTTGLDGGVGPGPGPGDTSNDDDNDDNNDDNDDNNDNDNDADNGEESTTGSDLPCPAYMGPYEIVEFIELDGAGAEDLSFSPTDGVLATMSDSILTHIDPDGIPTSFSDMIPKGVTTGTKYLPNGDVLVAHYPLDSIYRVDGTNGMVELFSEDPLINGPNGIVPDRMGNLWITSSANSRVLVLDPTTGEATTFISGNATVGFANGLIVDWDRMRVYWTDYDDGLINFAAFDESLTMVGNAGELADVGGRPDGMAQDTCGYLYTVDEGNQGIEPNRLIRVFIDEVGDRIGDPDEMLSMFPSTGLANPVFAQGPGWEDYEGHLFVTGFPGLIYTVDIQTEGAPTVADPGE